MNMNQILSPSHGFFLGREEEIESFRRSVDKYGIFGIIGIAGIGKTTLMERLARVLARNSYRIAWIFCSDRLHIDNFLFQANKWLVKFGCLSFDHVMKNENMRPHDRVSALFSILSHFPVVFCVDDFHTVNDRALLDLFARAAKELTVSKIIFSSRRKIHLEMDEPIDYWTVTLSGFDENEGLAFLNNLLGTKGEKISDDASVREIVRLTGGHLISLRIVATLLLKNHDLDIMRREWATHESAIADHLVETLRKSLKPEEITALQALSVFQRPPERADLFQVLSALSIERNFKDVMKGLLDTFVAREDEFGRIFLHHIIKDHFLHSMDPAAIRAIALLCAERFREKGREGGSIEDSLEAVYHLVKAEKFDDAAKLLSEIQDILYNSGTKAELASLITLLSMHIDPLPFPLRLMESKLLIPMGKVDQALMILGSLASDAVTKSDSIELSKNIGTCHVTMGDNEKAMAAFRRCLELAMDLDDEKEIILSHWMIGCIHSNQRNHLLALKTFNKCLERCSDEFLRAKILTSMGVTYTSLDRYDKAYESLEEAALIFERLDQLALLTFTRCNIAHLLVKKGEIPDARRFAEESLDLALSLGDSRLIHFSLKNLGGVHECSGEYSEAVTYYDKSLRIAEKFGNPHLIASVHLSMGNCLTESGDYTKAIEAFERAADVNELIDDQHFKAAYLSKKARVLALTGEYEDALVLIEEALEIEGPLHDKCELANLLTLKGNIFKDRGSLSQARELFVKSLGIYNQIESVSGLARVYHQMANLNFLEEDYEGARARYLYALRLTKKAGLTLLLQEILSGLAEVWLRVGFKNRARVLMETALRLSDAADSRKSRSYICAQLGKFHSIDGDLPRAEELLLEARNLKIQSGDLRGRVRVSVLLGDLFFKSGRFKEALAVYQEGLKLADEKRYATDRGILKINVGKALAALNHHQEAIVQLRNALNHLESTKDGFLTCQAHGFLYRLFEKRNMLDKTIFHQKRYANLKKKLSAEKQEILEKLVEEAILSRPGDPSATS